ncbi:MAG: hypothetical protein COA74_15335 [Gammaproteobacteria bacterium]|nr:MAG: hypothetical protein COA74_15335 [Gammaproteobacteria bacterium]
MALTPIFLSTGFTGQVARRIANIQNKATSPTSTVTELSDKIKTIKDNSLLYQLISRLLLSPKQGRLLNDPVQEVNSSSITTNDNAFIALGLNNNGDGLIDAKDNIFNSLLLMRLIDNEQFISELAKTDISSINLNYSNIDRITSNGDRIVQISDYISSDGQKGVFADLLLGGRSGIHS